jgi:hypothetical protein
MMKRKILLTVAAVILATAGGLLYLHGNRERHFLDHAFVQLRGGAGSEPVADIKLDSGDSAAVILEHDCCSGAGFDAVAIRISDGDEFYAKKNYCGIEGFYGALEADATKDLNRFKGFLTAQGYQKK